MSTVSKIDKIRNDIKLRIFQDKIQPGQLLSERKIAALYRVSRGTARKSLIDLQRHGLLSIIPSIGYRVNERKLDPVLVENGFKKELEEVYGKNFYSDFRLQLDYRRVPASYEQSKIFELKEKILIETIFALRTSENNRVKSVVTYYFPDFNVTNPQFIDTNLDSILLDLHSKIKKIKASVQFTTASENIADYLKITDKDKTVVKRTCLFISKSDKVIYYTDEYTNPEESVNVLPSTAIFRKVNGFLE